MKRYCDCVCDFGHRWSGFVDESEELPSSCHEGHEFITCTTMLPIDQVQITIRPAGRLADPIKNQYLLENRVKIVVSDIQGTWQYESRKTYSWREAETIVRLFEKRSLDQAKKIIEERKHDI